MHFLKGIGHMRLVCCVCSSLLIGMSVDAVAESQTDPQQHLVALWTLIQNADAGSQELMAASTELALSLIHI